MGFRTFASPHRPLSKASVSRVLAAALLVACGFVGLAGAQPDSADGVPASDVAASAPSGPIIRLTLQSAVQRIMADHLVEAIEDANRRDAAAVIIELDTPGGLVNQLRRINTAILGSEVPVVVFVAPSGAQAASAGFFMLMAADVAAMAPGTNTGAAATVNAGGADVQETLKEKIEQDSLAYLRSLLQRKSGRNEELAQLAVTESKSYSAEEALEGGLIDLIVPSFEQLVGDLDGFEFQRGEAQLTVRTRGVAVEERELTGIQRFLATLADPSIAYLLFSIGGMCLLLELYNPGSILPGVVGAICVILGAFGLSVLPVNYAGIALILVGLILFLLEIKIVSYGLLSVGGTICLVVGGLMLYRRSEPAFRVSVEVLVAVAVFCFLILGLLVTLVLRAHRNRVRTGSEGLIGERGVSRSELAPKGKVFVHGELWNAVAVEPVAADAEVEVVGVEGFTVRVRPVSDGSISGA